MNLIEAFKQIGRDIKDILLKISGLQTDITNLQNKNTNDDDITVDTKIVEFFKNEEKTTSLTSTGYNPFGLWMRDNTTGYIEFVDLNRLREGADDFERFNSGGLELATTLSSGTVVGIEIVSAQDEEQADYWSNKLDHGQLLSCKFGGYVDQLQVIDKDNNQRISIIRSFLENQKRLANLEAEIMELKKGKQNHE